MAPRVKRQRRADATAIEVEQQTTAIRELEALAATANETLFVLDRGGSRTSREKILHKTTNPTPNASSHTEKKLLQRALNVIKDNGGKLEVQPRASVVDLWTEEEDRGGSQLKGVKLRHQVIAPGKARSGQSYHPDSEAHQAMVAEVG
jgi:hypothetical protein